MKKAIAVLLLCAVAVAGVFADAELKFQPARIFDSISLDAGFDMLTASVRAYEDESSSDIKAEAMGPSAGITTLIDFSEVPGFLKEGWFGYNDIVVFFPNRIIIDNKVYSKDSDPKYSTFGIKAHMGVVRKVDFGIPVHFYFGAGLSYGMAYAWNTADSVVDSESVQSFGAAVLTMAEYAFNDHFAVTLTLNHDFTFLTRVESCISHKGSDLIYRYTSVGFGYGFAARAGVKYIF